MSGGKKTKKYISILIIIILALLILFLFAGKAKAPESHKNGPVNIPSVNYTDTFKTFSGKEFEELYNSFAYPNTQQINENTPITGNIRADKRLRELALARGYMIRSAPVTDTFVTVQKDMVLQPKAAKGWNDLKTRAGKQDINMSLMAAYRSAEDEKSIFLDRLKGIPVEYIAAGKADSQVDTVLAHTALPGYSRHHTGYTVDIACDSQPGVKFENSVCFKWLSVNNYLNAKKSGWIPSYPPGAGKQGPEPEPWEYVWVGTNALRQTL
ncbi:MAG TPA: D-alanyl-D-alanine carboxypeptidase family protein [Candidatus Saccharimonadales bacterium]|nr:D-alanyl-D-alanine carboxypeptidase family protein [Candidatus Saccharimonadales bacterium]